MSEPKESILSNSDLIASLGLSKRVRRCLENCECETIGDVLTHSQSEMLMWKNMGKVSLAEIAAALAKHGFIWEQS